MKRRNLLSGLAAVPALALLPGCAALSSNDALVGTGDLGVVVERARGTLALVNTALTGTSPSTVSRCSL